MKLSLEELVEKNLVREEDSKHGSYIVITDEGLKFLAEFKRIKELTDAFGLS
jgi:predicted transcriptional regulator